MRPSLHYGVAAVLCAALIVLFWDPLMSMVAQWDASPMYSYGYTVVPISAYLLSTRRDELSALSIAPSRAAGASLILIAIAMLSIGQVGALQLVQQLAFLVALVGIVLFLFGGRHLKISAPAIAYLLFMVPMWDPVTEPLHWPFQNNSARLGVGLMQAAGVPVFRDGTLITLPNLVLEVARECSGVNYLIAVLALALPLAWLRISSPWRRALLVVSALVVAALANGVRVALIGLLAYWDIGSPLHGPFHILHGLFVAAVGYFVLFAGLQWLQDKETPKPRMTEPVNTGRTQWSVRDAGALATVFVALAIVGVTPQAREVTLAQPLESLPLQLGRWTAFPASGVDAEPGPVASVWANADSRLLRRYRSDGGQTATVEVYYYTSQRQGREIISSTSSDLHRSSSLVDIPGSNGALKANALAWPERAEAGLFWYDFGGQPEADPFATKLSTMWRAIRAGRSEGAAIVIRTAADAQAGATLEDLARALQPALVDLWRPAAAAAKVQ